MNKQLKITNIISNYNVNGEIYRCDVKNFFGWDLSKEKVEELHKALTEMKYDHGHR